jgi:predicted O-linked N-acetylglucosamine transferase (SPINDLY family)
MSPPFQPRGSDPQRLLQQALDLHQRGDLARAEPLYQQVLRTAPNYFDALHFYGMLCFQKGDREEAVRLIGKALTINGASPAAFSNYGNVLRDLKRYSEALASYDRAIALNPQYANAFYNRGNTLQDLKRFEEAVDCYDRALQLNSDYAEAWCSRGNAFTSMKQTAEALFSYDRALAVRPNLLTALNNRGNALLVERRHREAAADFERLIAVDPDYPDAPGLKLHAQMLCCDWHDYHNQVAAIHEGIGRGKRMCSPFAYEAIATDSALVQKCSQIYSQAQGPLPKQPAWRGKRYGHRKIRLGYLSGEFRAQATSYLMAGVYDAHDRSRFEITAFDNGLNDKSPMRARLEAAFGGIVDIMRLSDTQAAAMIAEREIDILVNLNGYFGHRRNEVFAARAAPVQVNYLGFPATMGAPYMDYLIADARVVPQDERTFYDEKIVYLPECYQANDDKRGIGSEPTRVACGLPEDAVVFCSFNNSYKLDPEMFDVWMRILCAVEGSVLWLLESNAAIVDNLRREAEARGVAGERIAFAPFIAMEDHLARQSLADLFLDTLPYNAHTTASDALWAGLPVLTCAGTTFPGRVAASLLESIGLEELVTQSLADYEALAIRLGNDPAARTKLKHRLMANRTSSPLFDTARFTRHLEAAYTGMWERAERGAKPESFSVAPLSS